MRIINRKTWLKYAKGDHSWRLGRNSNKRPLRYTISKEPGQKGTSEENDVMFTFDADILIFMRIRLSITKWEYNSTGGRYNGSIDHDRELVTMTVFSPLLYFKLRTIKNELLKEEARQDFLQKKKRKIQSLPKAIQRELKIDQVLEEENK